VLSGCMDMVIVLEFCKWEEFCPIVLLFTHKNLEVLFEFLVDMFCLSISLRVVSCGCTLHSPWYPIGLQLDS
jgi:hypothetical protein